MCARREAKVNELFMMSLFYLSAKLLLHKLYYITNATTLTKAIISKPPVWFHFKKPQFIMFFLTIPKPKTKSKTSFGAFGSNRSTNK